MPLTTFIESDPGLFVLLQILVLETTLPRHIEPRFLLLEHLLLPDLDLLCGVHIGDVNTLQAQHTMEFSIILHPDSVLQWPWVPRASRVRYVNHTYWSRWLVMVHNHEHLTLGSIKDTVGMLFQLLITINHIVAVAQQTNRTTNQKRHFLRVRTCHLRHEQEWLRQKEPCTRRHSLNLLYIYYYQSPCLEEIIRIV
jgi:hypothetical protein